jgi:hypothetical protein
MVVQLQGHESKALITARRGNEAQQWAGNSCTTTSANSETMAEKLASPELD